jgi:hypothetical protein
MISAQYMRHLMVVGIGAIAVTGLWAVGIVLLGEFSDFQVRALTTTFVVGYYSLTTAATFGEGKVFGVISTAGAAVAVVGLVLTLPMIWVGDHIFSTDTFKAAFSTAAIAFGVAHAAINLRVSGESPVSVIVVTLANICVLAVTAMVVHLIVVEVWNFGDMYVRVLIALAIANVTLSLINPIVARMTRVAVR